MRSGSLGPPDPVDALAGGRPSYRDTQSSTAPFSALTCDNAEISTSPGQVLVVAGP